MPTKSGHHTIPDYDGLEDEAFPPLPPPDSPGQAAQDDADPFGNGEASQLAEVPAAKRRGVKRPQPKLDAQRLISERGLPALRTLFENVHFKGKGHEAENLRLLMQKMENWAHRLYPKLQFEGFIDKVEKLGQKKEVQTCLKRIRLDMPLTHEDLLGEDVAAPEMQIFGDPDVSGGGAFFTDPGPVHSTPAPSLTEEQRRRMELNRQRAMERRFARQQQQTDLSESQTMTSTPADGLKSVSSANALNTSINQEEKVEDLNGPVDSRVEPADNNPVHTDSEPLAESTVCKEAKEMSLSPGHQGSNTCEDGD
ncbi:TIMELESS-interacting protein [Betta splendens]|uniref:TIMELESS-interacting protein n=1 Tax=Betta splendens TaxID=158456 RepID=A0A6P7M1Q8_BETSP|nr:TIMELESS-interacting protein [Betta splendens]